MTNEDALQLIETLRSRRTLALSAVAELSAAFAGTPLTFDLSAHLEVRVHCGGFTHTLVRCEWLEEGRGKWEMYFRTSEGTGPTGSFLEYKPGSTWEKFLTLERAMEILHEALLHAPCHDLIPLDVDPDSLRIPVYNGTPGLEIDPSDLREVAHNLAVRRAARRIARDAPRLFREGHALIGEKAAAPYLRLHQVSGEHLRDVYGVVTEYLKAAGWPVSLHPRGVGVMLGGDDESMDVNPQDTPANLPTDTEVPK